MQNKHLKNKKNTQTEPNFIKKEKSKAKEG